MSHVRIELTDHGLGKVFIDGVEVPMVAEVRFRSRPGEANRVLLVVHAKEITVDAPALISQALAWPADG